MFQQFHLKYLRHNLTFWKSYICLRAGWHNKLFAFTVFIEKWQIRRGAPKQAHSATGSYIKHNMHLW